MTRYEPIGEIDLFAYADGLLEGDAVRRAEIERYLASDPEAAAHVAEIQAQNREIREAYGSAMAQPVPDRLAAVLVQPRRNYGRRLAGASAAVLVLLAAVVAGWLAGRHDDSDRLALEAFARGAAAQHQVSQHEVSQHHVSAAATGVQPTAAVADAEPLAWLNQRLALEIKAPDLSAEGFALVGKSRVGPDDDGSVQLVYRNEGALLSLFVRPRWEERSDPIEVVRSDGVAVHYWLDGPLAFALASDQPPADAERLARVVHEAVGRSRLTDPAPTHVLSQPIPPLDVLGREGGMPSLSSEPIPFETEDGEPQVN
jgi:anti-sigma factor RsiW